MTTIAQAHAAIKARAEAGFTAAPIRWHNDPDPTLPDAPAGFVFVEVAIDGFDIVAFGGGIGGNEQRSSGVISALVFVPLGTGLETGLAWAAQIAAVFNAVKADGLTYGAAEGRPATGRSDDGNYALVADVECDFHFYRTV